MKFKGEPDLEQIYGNHHVHTAGVSASGHLRGGVGVGGNLRRNPTVAAAPSRYPSAHPPPPPSSAAGRAGSPKGASGTEITTETEFVTSSGADEW